MLTPGMGSTREEVSGVGAKVGTYGYIPITVAVDVTHAKTPDRERAAAAISAAAHKWSGAQYDAG